MADVMPKRPRDAIEVVQDAIAISGYNEPEDFGGAHQGTIIGLIDIIRVSTQDDLVRLRRAVWAPATLSETLDAQA